MNITVKGTCFRKKIR